MALAIEARFHGRFGEDAIKSHRARRRSRCSGTSLSTPRPNHRGGVGGRPRHFSMAVVEQTPERSEARVDNGGPHWAHRLLLESEWGARETRGAAEASTRSLHACRLVPLVMERLPGAWPLLGGCILGVRAADSRGVVPHQQW